MLIVLVILAYCLNFISYDIRALSGTYHLQEWSLDMKGADAVWFNVLDHGGALANGIDYLHLGELSGARVFMSLESEVYYPYMLTAKSQGFFEYMVDYRIWDTPANTSPNSSVADIPAVYLGNPTIQDTAIDFRKPPSLPKRTDAYIASFISNCFSKNDRSAYLEELMTYMPVHSYGACHHTIDEPEALVANESISKFDRKMLLGKGYFFWFTAENSNAYSYVTEKIYQAFDAGVVPVYFGAPNIERFVPDPSAIIVADRYSPKELAELLNRTANNPDEYASFFAWKTKPYSQDFMRVMGLASRTVQCRLAMHLQGLDMELD